MEPKNEPPKIRLQKILSAVVSRRRAEAYIAAGRVTVNGQIAVIGTKADPHIDEVCLDGVPVKAKEAPLYIMLNKPVGVIATANDPQGRPTVFDLLPAGTRVFSVGRLDIDTGGLLLLTNDGDFAFRVAHPSREVKKTYVARVRGIPGIAALQAFRTGIEIESRRTAPCHIEVIKKEPNALVRITLHEGRNRQVRKMCEAIGHRAVSLKRVAVGALHLGGLAPGKWRHLTSQEVDEFS